MKYELVNPTDYFPFKLFLFESTHADRLIATHWHESTELIFCIEGELSAQVSNSMYRLGKKETLVINSNVAHSTWSPIENKVLIIQFPCEIMDKLTLGEYRKSKTLNIHPDIKENQENDYSKIVEYLSGIASTYEEDKKRNYWRIMSDIYKLFDLLTNNFMAEISENEMLLSQSKSLNLMQSIVDYIDLNYQENLTLSETAKFYGYNSSYFSRFFKEHFGVNYSDYVKSVRLEKSYRLLSKNNLSIIEIALESGFNSSKSFTNAFKEKFKHSPHQYRLKYL